jgi:hypothetical protein
MRKAIRNLKKAAASEFTSEEEIEDAVTATMKRVRRTLAAVKDALEGDNVDLHDDDNDDLVYLSQSDED